MPPAGAWCFCPRPAAFCYWVMLLLRTLLSGSKVYPDLLMSVTVRV